MPSNNEVLELTSVEMRQRIGSKEISPVELLEASIARIEALNPAVNAIAATDFATARKLAASAEASARKGEALGALHGLPTGIKDLHETAGLLTTYGSPLYRGFVPQNDAAMVTLVRKAGAIILCKTNVPEFGAGANTRNVVWGATGNPFDPRLNAGGSSGGAAVALACDMLPVCTGSDTGGSLRIPAAICGVVGFRPSPGVVPADGRPLGWTPISVLGPMGRTVGDLRLLFAVQAGMDDREPLAFPLDAAAIAAARPVDLGRLRVAYTEDFGQCPVSAEIRRVFRSRIAAMRHLFRSCDEVAFDFGEADTCFDVVRAQSYVDRYRDDYNKDPNSLGPNVRGNYEMAAKMTLAEMARAHAEQTRIFRRAVADGTGDPFSMDRALSGRTRRGAPAQLLPLAGADLCDHARDQPCDVASVRGRRAQHAVRVADHRPLPRRPRPPRRGGGHGAGICPHSGSAAPAPRPRQARKAFG
jgi:amidase